MLLVSLSSSLSPRLKGSLSATGLGSTFDKGSHLLGLPAGEGFRSGREPGGIPISSGAPSWNDTLRGAVDGIEGVGLKSSGFARGRVVRRGGAVNGTLSDERLAGTDEKSGSNLRRPVVLALRNHLPGPLDPHHIDHGPHFAERALRSFYFRKTALELLRDSLVPVAP